MISPFDEIISKITNYTALSILLIVFAILGVAFSQTVKKHANLVIASVFIIIAVSFLSNMYYANVTVNHICDFLFEDRTNCQVYQENVKLNSEGKLEIEVYRDRMNPDTFLVSKKQYSDKKNRKREKITLVFKSTWTEDGLTSLIDRRDEVKKIIAKYQSFDKEFDASRQVPAPEKDISAK